MHWSVKLFLMFMILGLIFVLWDIFFGPKRLSCVDSCSKNDIQCQRDCELEDDRWDVSM